MFPPGSPPTFPELGPEALFGIQCGDVSLRSNNLNEIKPIVEEIFEASYWFGDYQTIFPVACSHWKFRAKERFYGPFVGKTQNPILFISSPYDVVTPMVSARNVSAGFDGSIVLEHRGFGHTSLSQPSRCVIDATRAYFVNGTLPSPDTVCEPDYSFFSNHTIVESYEQAEDGEFGTNGTGVVRREVEEISLGRFLGSFTSPFGLLRSPW